MIFEDATHRRWKLARAVFALLGLGALATGGLMVASVVVHPPLPALTRQEMAGKALAMDPQAADRETPIETSAEMADRERLADLHSYIKGNRDFLSTAFLVQKDRDSLQAFRKHSDMIDVVFPDWYFLVTSECTIGESINPTVTEAMQEARVAIIPRVTNGDRNTWHTQEIQTILHSVSKRNCVVKALAASAKEHQVQGLNIDIEALRPSDKTVYLQFLKELALLLHGQDQLLTVAIPASDPAFDAKFIGSIADAVIVMAYDQHDPASEAGPISSQEWFANVMAEASAAIPATKLIMGVGVYGYDWNVNATEPAASLKFNEVMTLAKSVDAHPEMDIKSRNMLFAYQDRNDQRHEVWFLNAATMFNQWQEIRRKQALGIGVWRLGSEDPTVWSVLAHREMGAKALTLIPPLENVQYKNPAEVFQIVQTPTPGKLYWRQESDDSIVYATYLEMPSGFVLDRAGNEIGDKQVTLTFSDGPDEVWTPRIMGVLNHFQVPATFFVVGERAEREPELMKLMAKQGYVVGNHTYLRPEVSKISPQRLTIELNTTQRIIESTFGNKTALFRSPSVRDAGPISFQDLSPLKPAGALGYLIVGGNIDASDWDYVGVDPTVARVKAELKQSNNHVIILHNDAAHGERTVATLRSLIPELQKDGYIFVGLDQATGLAKEQLNPPLQGAELLLVRVTALFTGLRHWGWSFIVLLFYLTTSISVLRIVVMGILVIRSTRHTAPTPERDPDEEYVTILIPAYNEEKTIAKTLLTLQQSRHERFEALVINDGSKDRTAQVVKAMQATDKRIKLIDKENGGKASALNMGFAEANYEIVVTIDADTVLLPETVTELIRPFGDPRVDAVCGNVEVGNVHNLLTGFQALEYITTQNFDRRAFEEVNCITVVPGATGAWRRDKVLALGGYEDDTLTEDADITLRLLRAGGKVVYAPAARSHTEAPETNRALAKQRFRWSFGTFQCLRKHSVDFFHGALGWVALPNMFLFQVLFPSLSPIGDLVFVIALLRGELKAILAGYILFLVMDLCGSLLAFTLEKRPKKLMWLVLLQRFYYRQFMYIITFRSLLAILRGNRYGWSKLQRTGNVHVPFVRPQPKTA